MTVLIVMMAMVIDSNVVSKMHYYYSVREFMLNAVFHPS